MNTHWWEIAVIGKTTLEDLIFCRLQNLGCQGTASQYEKQGFTVRGYLHQDQVQPQDLEQLAVDLNQDAARNGAGQLIVHWRLIAEENWASSWQDYWHPQEIGDRLLIYPAWLTPPNAPDRLLLRLNPGVAFGTGTHATTQLCLEALEQQLTPSQEQAEPRLIADIGCGTGILSIAALLLGAERAYAVDTDSLAVDAARACRDLNGISEHHMLIRQGSMDQLLEMLEQPVHGFVCNILAHVIQQLIPQFAAITQPQGWGILSGILCRQAQEVIEVLIQYGWKVFQMQQQADWCCLYIGR